MQYHLASPRSFNHSKKTSTLSLTVLSDYSLQYLLFKILILVPSLHTALESFTECKLPCQKFIDNSSPILMSASII